MENETKALIIFIAFMVTFAGGVIYIMIQYTDYSNDMTNICAREYGYEERGNWEKEGTMDLNYKYVNFNQTHIACCKRVSWIDTNGQIQKLNCTDTFTKRGNKE